MAAGGCSALRSCRAQGFGNTPARITAILLPLSVGDFLPRTPQYETSDRQASDEGGFSVGIGFSLVRNDTFTVRRFWRLPDAEIVSIRQSWKSG